MKRVGGFSIVVWALLGLLVLSAIAITTGRQEDDAFPAADRYAASGASAAAELLRRMGVEVAIDRRSEPKLRPDDIAVVFRVDKYTFNVLDPDEYEDTEDDTGQASAPKKKKGEAGAFEETLQGFLEEGGGVLVLPLTENYRQATLAAREATVTPAIEGKPMKVTLGEYPPSYDPTHTDPSYIDLWSNDKELFARSCRIGEGTEIIVEDGLFATNRFLKKADNANMFASLIKTLGGGGKRRVVFLEAGFGNIQDPGFFETIGNWATVAWWQCLFLFAVIVATLSKRFGLPEPVRPRQRGARELLDAVADTYFRAKATPAAMDAAFHRCDARLRSALKLPRDASRGERDRLLPESLTNSLARLEAAAREEKVAPDDALKLVQAAEREVDRFLGDAHGLAA